MRILRSYINTYNGLSKPAWMLACVLLINRTGMMVLPFLSLYLKEGLGFSVERVGMVLTLFGLGSLCGSYLGGYLADKFGTFLVQFWSLILTGIGFLVLSQITNFYSVAIGFFCITVLSESFRPANTASVAKHAKPENLTRAYSLNRMAINLGFAIGPAFGGFLAHINYEWLFYVNAAASIASGLVFASYFYARRDKKAPEVSEISDATPAKSPFKDSKFIGVFFLTVLYGVVFFQLIFTLPVYYRDVYHLSETKIGWILAFNGLVVFLLEMPLVYSAGKYFSLNRIIATGAALLVISYLFLYGGNGVAILVIAMAFLSVSEILVMPFLTSYAANRGGERSRGKYLGVYAMAYSLAFIVTPSFAFYIIEKFGYRPLWLVLSVICTGVTVAYFFVIRGGLPKSELATEIEKADSKL